jgi:hypothetical protein
MNERILELARVAEQLADNELAHLERVHNRLYSFTESREIYNQKFAELIVRECGVALSPMLRDMVSRGQAFDLIKQHFGVEE